MDPDLTPDDRVIAALRRIVRAIDLRSRHLVESFSVTRPRLIAVQDLARLGVDQALAAERRPIGAKDISRR